MTLMAAARATCEVAMSHSMVATLAHAVMEPVSLAAKQAASDGHYIVFPPHGYLRYFANNDRIESAHVQPGPRKDP
jgi:hypothetical protein